MQILSPSDNPGGNSTKQNRTVLIVECDQIVTSEIPYSVKIPDFKIIRTQGNMTQLIIHPPGMYAPHVHSVPCGVPCALGEWMEKTEKDRSDGWNESLKRRLSPRSSNLNAKTRRLSNQPFENSAHRDDDDVIILEENSTPKPAVDHEVEVKLETGPVEQGGARAEPVGAQEPGVQAGSAGSSSRCDQGTAATQTELPGLVVKKEEAFEDDIDSRNGDAALPPPCVEAQGQPRETAETCGASAGDPAGCQLSKVRQELLLATQEKERYRSQCQALAAQVKDWQQRVAELNDRCVKKETCHQATETEAAFLLESMNGEAGGPGRTAAQYQQALEELERLRKQCGALQLLKTECGHCSRGEDRSEVDEMVVQLDDVFRQLDRCTVERDQYKSEIELLEVEKSQIRSQCEELKNEIERLKSANQPTTGPVVSTSSSIEEAVNYASGESLKLRSLRVNVGQLLAMIVPDLDLQQVNYDVDVVDEILGQVVEQMSEISST